MRKLFLLLFGVVFFAVQAMAQRTITGKVTDDKGLPVANASVMVKGTTIGTNTKTDGTFSLPVSATAETITVSAVGYLSQDMDIGSQTNMSFVLKGEERVMDEVVVVGYGTQQKKAFTGSASKVDAKEIANLVTPSIDKQLAGRAAGVQVTNQSGLVNQPARIFVRGINSITQGQGPLFVVDGIPIISGNLANTTNSNQLADINPADIENIEVLKDGSATAIFGSRAAGGVVMITTKKGSKGKARVNYDASIGLSNVLKRFDLLNADQFVAISNEKFINSGSANRAGVNPGGTNTDWQSIALIDNALVQNHNLSFQGGGQKTLFFFSLNYSKQQGTVRSNSNNLMRARFNLEHDVNNFIKIGNNLLVTRQYNTDQNNGGNSLSGAIVSALRLLPNVAPYNNLHPSGYNISFPNANSIPIGPNTISVDDNFTNVAFTTQVNKYSSETYRIFNTAFIELSFTKKLKFRSQLAGDWFNDYGFQSWDPRHGDGYSANGLGFNSSQNILRYTWQNYFNYNLNIGRNHNFYLTAGHELQKQEFKIVSAQGQSFSDFFFLKENLISNSASTQNIGGSYSRSGFESLFGRFNYDYKNKYFFQASIRRDGQSSLAANKRYGNFPGYSLGWRLSEEKAWKDNSFLSKWFSDVKLKYSYAKVGNTLGGLPYLSATYGPVLYGGLNAIGLNFIGNPDLQWETSAKYDFGVEIGMLRGRANITLDWFKNDVDNLVLAVPTPPSGGVPGNSIQQNIGKLVNKGIEFALDVSVIRKKDFGWDFNFNYSNVKNKITELYDVNGTPVPYIPNGVYNLIRVGDPINIIHGYQYAGVNTANGFPMYYKADGRLVVHSSVNGQYYYITSPNDGNLLSSNVTSLTFNDRQNLGQGIPTYFGAFTNSFRYKQFEMEVMFRYSGGNKIMNVTRQETLLSNSFHNNGVEILERWTKPGDVTNVPKLYWGQSNRINQNGLAISRFVEKGDYIRLQNISFAYTMDKELVSRITKGNVESLRFFVQGQNLYVWTKYTGADPDNITAGGIDDRVSPQIRTISFGLNVGF
ncbi:MAG TPA: TonB-dependent receptor [Chitinophagaceae bacterium]|nr:TonB-dependent receptor [Chitinophagaceae bacterium]